MKKTENEKLEEILIEMWSGTRNETSLFKKINLDQYIGYITAMSYVNEPKINKLGIGVSSVFECVQNLIKQEKI